MKEDAIGKVLDMRNRQILTNTEEETMTADFWKQKWAEQQALMEEMREENVILQQVCRESASQSDQLQNQVLQLQQENDNQQQLMNQQSSAGQ